MQESKNPMSYLFNVHLQFLRPFSNHNRKRVVSPCSCSEAFGLLGSDIRCSRGDQVYTDTVGA